VPDTLAPDVVLPAPAVTITTPLLLVEPVALPAPIVVVTVGVVVIVPVVVATLPEETVVVEVVPVFWAIEPVQTAPWGQQAT
jgi:hypothetical protein